jgi:hypothetical protein
MGRTIKLKRLFLFGEDMNEEWRDVVGWEGCYQVSNLGRVRSKDRIIIRTNWNYNLFATQLLKGKLLHTYKVNMRIETPEQYEEIKEKFDKIYQEQLGVCECGQPYELKVFLRDLLEIQLKCHDSEAKDKFDIREKDFEELFNRKTSRYNIIHFIFCMFERIRLMTHGGSAYNSWLEADGYDFLDMLRTLIKYEDEFDYE